ncbi:hypothetical protein ACTXT7_008055 [Hymenolepis weldensis]
MEQMNLWNPDKHPEDYIKNVGEFHYEPSVGEVFATWSMKTDSLDYLTKRVTILFRKFSKRPRSLSGLSPTTFEEGVAERGSIQVPCIHSRSLSTCSAEIRLKLLSVLDKNPDVMLHHLVDEYNVRSLIIDSNMVESNETRAFLIRKPKVDRSTENNPTPQP